MSDTKVNTQLLRDTADAILKEQDRFDMSQWVMTDAECGTVCCIAGHIMMEAGYVPQKYAMHPGWNREGVYVGHQETPEVATRLVGKSIYVEVPDDFVLDSSAMVQNNIWPNGKINIFYAEWLDAEGAAKALYKAANDEEEI